MSIQIDPATQVVAYHNGAVIIHCFTKTAFCHATRSVIQVKIFTVNHTSLTYTKQRSSVDTLEKLMNTYK